MGYKNANILKRFETDERTLGCTYVENKKK